MPAIRQPTVAGQFYEGNAEALRAQIKACFLHEIGPKKLPEVNFHFHPRKVAGLVCPHAGYMCSGPVAARAYYELAVDGLPETVVVLGPNHTGYGSALALMREGVWRTPLGDVHIDTDLADSLLHETRIVDVDDVAHKYEHSIEVQLPFLQYLYGEKFKFVPVCFQMQDYDSAVEVGRALVEVLDARNAVVVASSDMTHYEPAKRTAAKDQKALKAVTDLDAKHFYEVIEGENVTACGYGPIMAVITYAKGVNAKAEILSYHNSGDIIGDSSSVVGYAAVSFRK